MHKKSVGWVQATTFQIGMALGKFVHYRPQAISRGDS